MFYDNDPHKKREQLRKKREFDQHRMSIEQGSNNVPHSITNMRDAYQQVMDKKINQHKKRLSISAICIEFYQSDD